MQSTVSTSTTQNWNVPALNLFSASIFIPRSSLDGVKSTLTRSLSLIPSWLLDHSVRYLCGHLITLSYTSVVTWSLSYTSVVTWSLSYTSVVTWSLSYTSVVTWLLCLMHLWSFDHAVLYLCGHLITLSYTSVVTWSFSLLPLCHLITLLNLCGHLITLSYTSVVSLLPLWSLDHSVLYLCGQSYTSVVAWSLSLIPLW